ncbi:MAG: SO_0444 family Cu/Zn efflux transporter [Candidatus Omnitrophica bacterium]|nr:SO_0444 family Cu/Zn efflux transporter [Candidatus Omnitrophota bacterium]
MGFISGIIKESFFLLNRMSPYLLFGFLVAGILHMFINTETIGRHLGKSTFYSVVKASVFGVPLPLCSCGVLPAAVSLRKQGASKGAILSFLISTPTTGVDSILATYSLMGGFFTAFRVLASLCAGIFSGVLANLFLKEEGDFSGEEEEECRLCGVSGAHEHPLSHKIGGLFRYSFGELLGDAGLWIITGVIIGGAITYFLPEEFINTYLGTGWKAMFVMLLVGIPMYVCGTGSIPIAVALMLKGMNPGAAFVFLLAGPATNTVGMTIVSRQMGRKALYIYITSIVFSSMALGFLLDFLWRSYNREGLRRILEHQELIPGWAGVAASAVLLALIAAAVLRKNISGLNSGKGGTR